MKTTLEVDQILLNQARKILGTQTIRDTVEQSLRTVIPQRALERLANAGGSIDLDLTVERLREQRSRKNRMQLVDASVWIEFLRPAGTGSPKAVQTLDSGRKHCSH